jgi:tetratricopeptide (TPR) repeat protein
MRTNQSNLILAALAALTLAACGPGTKPGPKTGGDDDDDGGGTGPRIGDDKKLIKCPDGVMRPVCPETIDRKPIEAGTKKAFAEALAFYNEKTKGGWTDDVCSAVAERWADMAGSADKMVEARFNAGMSWHKCGKLDRAEGEYKKALAMLDTHAPSISNLGEIEFRRGNVRKAEEMWQKALSLDSKLIGARNNIAWLLLVKMRETTDRSAWNKLEKEARDQLSSVLAVDQENVPAYVLYGLVYMEGSERNSNRLDLAKLLLDEAAKRNDKYAPLHNARGLWYMRRKSPGPALEKFMQAVTLDPDFLEARMNVGNITLGFRKYDVAAEQFQYVIGKRGKDYDAHIGLGIAQRGNGKLDEAEKEYNAAKEIDGKKGEAYFNLGVLYQGFKANKAGDLKLSQDAYRKAKGFFQDAISRDLSQSDKDEAKDLIQDCDKVIKQLDDAIKAQNAPPEPDPK